jgi:hypothetical protein
VDLVALTHGRMQGVRLMERDTKTGQASVGPAERRGDVAHARPTGPNRRAVSGGLVLGALAATGAFGHRAAAHVSPTAFKTTRVVVPAATIIPAEGALLGAFVKHDPSKNPGVSEPETLEAVSNKRLGIDHSFQHWGAPFLDERLRDDVAKRRIPMLSWGAGPQATLAATATGANDSQVRLQAQALRALGDPVLLRFTWEMDLPQRGYSPTTFKDAWRRVRSIFREEGADNVAFVFCPTWLAYVTGQVSSYWPGDSYVDWVGADGYARPTNNHAPLTELFSAFYDFGIRHGHPMIICEAGVYFDSRGDGETDWVLTGNPQTEAAWRQLAHDPHFLPRHERFVVVNLALGSTVDASSTLASNHVLHAVDGNRATRWISGSSDPRPVLTVDLGQECDVHRVSLSSGVGGSTAFRVRAFVVEALLDSRWTTIGEVAGNTDSPVELRLPTVPEGIRHLRVVFTEPSPTDATARVFELEVMGIRR